MKLINVRKVVMAFSGILAATVAAGCFGGGPGYSQGPYGYNSSYSSYGSSYPYSGYNSGYSYPRSSGNSYNATYQNEARSDGNHGYNQHAVVARDRVEAPASARKSSVDQDKYSRNDTEAVQRAEKN